MDIKNENDITKLKTEIERLQALIQQYEQWKKSDSEISQRLREENKELKCKVIAYEVKASGIDLRNNREEIIIKIMTVSIDNEEMRKRVETAPKDKIKLNIEGNGYQLIVSTIPSQAISIYKTKEEIEDILKRLDIPKEENSNGIKELSYEEARELLHDYETHDLDTVVDNMNVFKEIEQLLEKSQYNWMRVQKTIEYDKWQIIDRRTNKVRFEGTPKKILETVKEITQA